MKLTFAKTGKLIIGLTVLVVIVLCAGGCFWRNHPPVINSLHAGQELVLSSDSCTIECLASDPDGDSLGYNWSATGGEINGNGSDVTWIAPASGSGSYTITIVVSDEKGAEAEDSVTVEVNNKPYIVSLIVDEEHVAPSSNCNIECDASDADGDSLSYFWSASSGEGTISWEGPIATWSAPSDTGSYIIRVEVRDGRGGKAVEYLTINLANVASNNPPEIKSLTTDDKSVRKHETATIKCRASDPDGDELSYVWSADGGDISWEGSVATWTAPGEIDTFTITVTVSDDKGGEDTETIDLRVCT